MTAFSRKKKRSSEGYRGSCEPIAEGEFKLVEAEQRDACRGKGVRLGPFLLLYPYEPQRVAVYNSVTLPLLLLLIAIYAMSYTKVSTYGDLLGASLGFLGGLLLPFSIQIIVTEAVSKKDGVSVNWLLFPVPSPIPTALVSFFPSRAYSSSGKASLAAVAGLLAGSLSSLALALWSQSVMQVYPKTLSKPLIYYPFFFNLSGFLNPIASGAFAYSLSAFFQLMPYPYSVGWYLSFPKPLSLIVLTLWLGVKSNIPSSELYAPLAMIVLILTLFEGEKPVSDPWERSRLASLLAVVAIILLSPTPH